MNWANITDSEAVVALLKLRESLECIIISIDSKVLINYELEKIAED